DTFAGFLGNARAANPLGLYDVIVGKDISILKGNGLGGTSLINANAAIIPEGGGSRPGGRPDAVTRRILTPSYRKAPAVRGRKAFPAGKPLLKRLALEK